MIIYSGDRMRVCLLNRYFNFKGTGVTRIATEVSNELERTGNTVIKYATNGDSLYSYAYHTMIKPVTALPRKNIDVYHALATMESMWLPKDKSVATFLDLFTTTNPDRAGAGMGYSKWKLTIGKAVFELGSKVATHCRYLVCISEKTKQDVIEYLHPDTKNLRVIKLGIQDDLEGLKLRHKRFTIGTLSQLDKRKRIDILIRQFKASKIDAELLIAGQGSDRQLLEETADNDDRIKFSGLVPNNKLCDWYNSIDLFCFPTAIEGYGLPAVEAMACRKPVVVLEDSILPKEIKDRCFTVKNYTDLFNNNTSMDTVFNCNDYDDNYMFAKSHSWKDCVKQYIDLYKNITEDN